MRGEILEDLSALISLPRFERLPRHLSAEEISSLLEAEDVRMNAMLEVLYGTGLRASELVALKVEDIDLKDGVLFVRMGKGRKDRVVPFGPHLRKVLLRYLQEGRPACAGEHLFVTSKGGPIKTTTLNWLVTQRARRVGIRATPHSFRHSYATHLLRNGAPLPAIQALLGHSSLTSTQIYLGVDVSDLKKMIARSHPRERRASGLEA
jgi:site-specific recombinase XerD